MIIQKFYVYPKLLLKVLCEIPAFCSKLMLVNYLLNNKSVTGSCHFIPLETSKKKFRFNN